MNSTLLYVLLILFALAIIVFVIWQNKKDRKAFEQEANENYRKSKHEDGDQHIDMERSDKI